MSESTFVSTFAPRRAMELLPAAEAEEEGDEGLVESSRRLLTALSGAITAVKCFRGRWSAVSATLDRLGSSVDAIAEVTSGAGASNALVADFLLSVRETLTLTLTLALHCSAADPPAGKLLTQSQLSSAAEKLRQLVADADLLLSSAFVDDPAACGSRREAARAAARRLVMRLQIGDEASRAAALDELLAFLAKDEKYVVIAVAQGAVPAVARLLDAASSGATRAKAVAAIARVSAVESCWHVIAAEGSLLVLHLARALESGDAREGACEALRDLTLAARDNAMAIGSRGGIASLLDVAREGTPSSQAASAAVLANLAAVRNLHANFLEENSIPILTRLLSSGTFQAQENVLQCFRNLSLVDDHSIKLAIIKDGFLDRLKDYLQAGNADSDRNLEPSIGLLRNLATFRYIGEIIVSSGFLPLVVTALCNSAAPPATRAEAALAIAELALSGSKERKEIGESGCIPWLVSMLEAKVDEEKNAAMKALAASMMYAGNRRLFKKENRGIVNVVQTLDPLVKNVDKKYPVTALLLVSQSRRCRKQMVAAGACGYLRRLVDAEVEGAKKLLDSLGRGILWGTFPKK